MSKLFDKDMVEGLIKSGLTLEDLHKYLELQEEKKGDSRYNVPKEAPKASEADIDKAIMENEIYRRTKMLIMKAQRGQIGYGLDKYPETLNPNSWTILETFDHIIEESVDKLHYLVMLRIQLEQQLINDQVEEKHDTSDALRYAIERLTRDSISKGTMLLGAHPGADTDGDIYIRSPHVAPEDRLPGQDWDGDVEAIEGVERKVAGIYDQYDNKYIIKDGVLTRA